MNNISPIQSKVEEIRLTFYKRHAKQQYPKRMIDILDSYDIEVAQALTETANESRREGYIKAIEDCINAIPLRSDWDDDVKVTAQMVINATREALESYLPS